MNLIVDKSILDSAELINDDVLFVSKITPPPDPWVWNKFLATDPAASVDCSTLTVNTVLVNVAANPTAVNPSDLVCAIFWPITKVTPTPIESVKVRSWYVLFFSKISLTKNSSFDLKNVWIPEGATPPSKKTLFWSASSKNNLAVVSPTPEIVMKYVVSLIIPGIGFVGAV